MGKKPKVVSLIDIIKNNEAAKLGEFPEFEGNVLAVNAQIICEDNIYSILDYCPKGVKLPQLSLGELILGQGIAKFEKDIIRLSKRVFVPFNVHPDILIGSEVKGYKTTFGSESREVKAYVLEVVRGSAKNTDPIVQAAMDGKTVHTGFKYVKIL